VLFPMLADFCIVAAILLMFLLMFYLTCGCVVLPMLLMTFL